MSVSAAASSGYSDPNQFAPVLPSENAVTARAARGQAKGQDGQDDKHPTLFQDGDDAPSFWDLLDVINPLQHIPVVNTLYQELTGDKIGVGAKLVGDTLLGGPIGLIASAINCIVEEETGDDIGGHVLALFKGDGVSESSQIADNSAAAAQDKTAAAQKPAPVIPPVPVADVQTPVIPAVALGDTTATASVNAATTAPMMFGADGLIVGDAATATTTAATAATATTSAAAAPAGKSMPVPPRRVASANRASPPISVPISSNGTRSNVPITGYNPANYRVPDATTVQKAMAAQGLPANTQHPMLPNAEMPPAADSPDWFQSMNQALDKYQKAGNLASRPESTGANMLQ